MTDSKQGFAERVRVLLARLDMTQDQLAEAMGVRRQAISLWMTGNGMPHPSRMFKFEELERRVATDPSAKDAEAILSAGTEEFRRWLRGYTERVIRAHEAGKAIAEPNDALVHEAGEAVRRSADAAASQPDSGTRSARRRRG